jgi:hypothetical protein
LRNTFKTRHSKFRNNRKEQGSIYDLLSFGKKTTKRVLNIEPLADGQKQVQAIPSKNLTRSQLNWLPFFKRQDLQEFHKKTKLVLRLAFVRYFRQTQ